LYIFHQKTTPTAHKANLGSSRQAKILPHNSHPIKSITTKESPPSSKAGALLAS
jgi:hypothetical protein